jgi:hypothetical protein
MVADAVNQHKVASGAVVGISVNQQLFVGYEIAFGHLVEV